ncbi:carboxylesterase/lipase family protein [Jatrophihabitans sp. YIM 134969]
MNSLDVETSSGTFRGVRRAAGTHAWFGIPYAAAPVGPLRFRPPAPAVPLTGVRPADRYSAGAPQAGSLTAPVRALGDGVGEDCLYLNVHAPSGPSSSDTGRPVLVWIHGGAFTGGSGALYNGAHLADLGDLVVVTVNYRLGVFGFVDLGAVTDLDVSTNNGLRDQIAALRWVHENIAGFGGDPARVTVAGESAGSIAVAMLMCAPATDGLFRGAVMQSGSYSLVHGDRTRERIARRYLDDLGVTRDASVLRSLSTGRLLEAQEAVRRAVTGTTPAAPWFDDDLVPGSLQAAQSSTRPGVALLAGSNHDEVELFRKLPGDVVPTDRATVAARLTAALGEVHAARILRAYPADRRGDRALTTDFDFAQPTRHFAERHAVAGGPAFVYRFDAGVPWWGATHAAELPYLWNWKGPASWALRGPAGAARSSLAARLQWAWVRFVHDLDPGDDWPGYDPDTRAVRVFDVPGDHIEPDPHSDRRLAWAGADVMPKD